MFEKNADKKEWLFFGGYSRIRPSFHCKTQLLCAQIWRMKHLPSASPMAFIGRMNHTIMRHLYSQYSVAHRDHHEHSYGYEHWWVGSRTGQSIITRYLHIHQARKTTDMSDEYTQIAHHRSHLWQCQDVNHTPRIMQYRIGVQLVQMMTSAQEMLTEL